MTADKYTVDQQGPDGKWRVWWLNSQGYTVERFFKSKESAERWIDEVMTLELSGCPVIHDDPTHN